MILRIKWQLWLFVVTSVLFALTACSRNVEQAYAFVAPASLTTGDAIPVPTGEAILSISGDISVKNAGDKLVFDMETLEQLGLVEYTITDPWRGNQRVSYTGVLMSDLIEFAGVSPSASSIHMAALDDYQVDISIADIKKWPVLLATRVNGEHMSIENSGPTRIIFPLDAYPEIDRIAYKDLFIWNLESMEVK
jgi:hypothetical protein